MKYFWASKSVSNVRIAVTDASEPELVVKVCLSKSVLRVENWDPDCLEWLAQDN